MNTASPDGPGQDGGPGESGQADRRSADPARADEVEQSRVEQTPNGPEGGGSSDASGRSDASGGPGGQSGTDDPADSTGGPRTGADREGEGPGTDSASSPDSAPGTEDPASSRPAPASAEEGIRFALGTLTVIPVGVPRWDRESARRGMEWAPLAGLVVGLAAAAVGLALLLLGTSALVAAVASVAVPAVLTRALHLDGLADVADGLGSSMPADEALRIMKRSDIGPFGVLTLVLTLLAQTAVLNELYGEGGWAQGALAVVVSAVTARTAIALAARSDVPAARSEGLGALVAGTVPVRTAATVAAGVAVAAALAGGIVNWWNPLLGAFSCLFAVVLGLAAAEGLSRHCRRRFGGVTGDVFGAVAECASTTALVVLAFG
jgi:adenosylcobinamide-GDP ribazoletransferase